MVLSLNDDAIMDVNIVQGGLAIASVFFVIVGYVLIYENPLQQSTELETIAEQIQSMISHVDTYWIEQQNSFLFPLCKSQLIAEFSSEFIKVKSLNSFQNQIVKSVPQILWISLDNKTLSCSEDFHHELLILFGSKGTRDDPLLSHTNITKWFSTCFNETQFRFHQYPFTWCKGEYITLEKCIIFKKNTYLESSQSIPAIEFLILKKN